MSKENIEKELELVNKRLEWYLFAEQNILEGAQMYTVAGSQKLNASLKDVRDTIKMLKKEKDKLESILAGRNPRITIVNPTML